MQGGGQVRYITNLGRELVRTGHRVTLGCRPGSVLEETAAAIGAVALPAFHFRGGLRPASWGNDLGQVRQFVRESCPDILHANLSQDHWTCGIANRVMGSPVCVVRTRHNTYVVRDSAANRKLNRDWTDYQIVVCDTVRRTLAGQPTFDASRLCSIHNGVDAIEYAPDLEAREHVRAAFGYSAGTIVVGIAARLVKAKGHEFLFRALALLHREIPALRCLVLGQGELEGSLSSMAAALDISAIVQFAGFRNDMARCTQAFDIGAQPSIDCDTSSFSLKEQMACEKPVVASDYGGLVEIVCDGTEGLIVPQGTVEPLANAIRRLSSDPGLRERMGKAGRARVLREFTLEVFAARTIEAYRRALELHRERRA